MARPWSSALISPRSLRHGRPSVIMLWLDGGALLQHHRFGYAMGSHIMKTTTISELWESIRGKGREVQTERPGLRTWVPALDTSGWRDGCRPLKYDENYLINEGIIRSRLVFWWFWSGLLRSKTARPIHVRGNITEPAQRLRHRVWNGFALRLDYFVGRISEKQAGQKDKPKQPKQTQCTYEHPTNNWNQTVQSRLLFHFILFLVAIAPLSNYPTFGKQKRDPVISYIGLVFAVFCNIF